MEQIIILTIIIKYYFRDKERWGIQLYKLWKKRFLNSSFIVFLFKNGLKFKYLHLHNDLRVKEKSFDVDSKGMLKNPSN